MGRRLLGNISSWSCCKAVMSLGNTWKAELHFWESCEILFLCPSPKKTRDCTSLSPCRTEIQRTAEDAAQPWLMCPTSCTSVKEKKQGCWVPATKTWKHVLKNRLWKLIIILPISGLFSIRMIETWFNLAWKNPIDDILQLLLNSPMWHFRALLHPSDVNVLWHKSAEEDTYFFGD